jgi:hypothetical protein
MTKYKENDILIDEDGNKRKVLGVCGQVYFISQKNEFKYANGAIFKEKELEDMGYKLLEEEFNPEKGDTYYSPYIYDNCSVESLWENDEYDIERKDMVGIYRTKEESDVRLKKIINTISNLD